jgi:hypothetical protein
MLGATTGRAMLLCSDGRWPAPNFFVFFVFSFDSFKERTRARQREKRQGFETCFPALLVGKLLPVNSLLQRQLLLAAAATLAPSDSNNTLAPSGSNSTRSSNDNLKKNSRTYKQKKSVAFNMKHRKCSFSRIEMYCKEVVKAYVNGGRVVTTVSI